MARKAKTETDEADRPYLLMGRRLKAARMAVWSGTAEAFALRIGLTKGALSGMETGSIRVSLDPALRLADYYGVSMDWVYRGRWEGLTPDLRRQIQEIYSDLTLEDRNMN